LDRAFSLNIFNPLFIKTYEFKHKDNQGFTKGIIETGLIICISFLMGVSKLYRQSNSAAWGNAVLHVTYRSIVNILDDIGKEILKMAESKLLLLLLAIVGIPAYIVAWFLDLHGSVEMWKGLILAAIGGFTGLVLAARYLVKLMTEIQEYRKKYVKKKR
jgi:hypothetical protein